MVRANFVKSKHTSKPLGIVFHPTKHNVVLSRSVDGCLNVWKLCWKSHNATCTKQVGLQLAEKWATDMAFSADGNHLFYTNVVGGVGYLTTSQIPRCQLHKTSVNPHRPTKPPCCVAVSRPLSAERKPVFATGGVDKQLFLWRGTPVREGEKSGVLNFSTEILPSKHTASLFCLEAHYARHTLFSGGLDGRLQTLDLATCQVINAHKFSSTNHQARISGIQVNPRYSDVLLSTQALPEQNVVVLDHRVSYALPVLMYTYPLHGAKATTGIRADWSPDGVTIACGSVDNTIHFWDVRYNSSVHTHLQIATGHGSTQRIPQVLFHPTQVNSLVSISGDRCLGVHNFTRCQYPTPT